MNDEKLDKMKLDYFNNHIKRPFHPEASALIFFPTHSDLYPRFNL